MKFFELLQQRRTGVPVAYLVQEREFYSLPFRVASSVLIPRPETEQLVELAISQLSCKPAPKILDLGTGSGCIAITLALELRKSKTHAAVTGVDISAQALEIARSNALRLGAEGIQFYQSSWLESVHEIFDLIVANPPYIPVDDPNTSSDTCFEPKIALFSGVDGCDAYREILKTVRSHLKSDGIFIGEHGINQGACVRELAVRGGFRVDCVQTHQDLTGRDRFVVCKS